MRDSFVEVNLTAIRHNVELARSCLNPATKLCAVVKANSYGHGAVAVSRIALSAGAEYLAVAFAHEAIQLRTTGITAPILILGTLERDAATDVVNYDLEQTVYTTQHLQILDSAAQHLKKKAKIQIKVDTGMHRIGICEDQIVAFCRELRKYPNLQITGCFSHFATAEETDKDFSRRQYQNFLRTVSIMKQERVNPPLRHICNSAGIHELKEYQLDMVRQGITLYGLAPGAPCREYQKLEPAMQVKSKIAYVKTVAKGETVGYNRDFVALRPTKVATVPIGYADGYMRCLAHHANMIVHNRKAPIIGKICMDQCMLDVTDIPNVSPEDDVLVAGGHQLPLEEMAAWGNTIPYELCCLFSLRLPIIYKEE